jgi:predicted RNA-binding protein YlqC (UPF0109 family)
MKQLLELIITKALPEGTEFEITETSNDRGEIVFELKLPDEFKGKIIGKQGRNINAIRQVIGILARSQDQRVQVEVLD